MKKLDIANNPLPEKYSEFTEVGPLMKFIYHQSDSEIPAEYRPKIAASRTQKRGIFRDTLTLVKELKSILDDPMGM